MPNDIHGSCHLDVSPYKKVINIILSAITIVLSRNCQCCCGGKQEEAAISNPWRSPPSSLYSVISSFPAIAWPSGGSGSCVGKVRALFRSCSLSALSDEDEASN